MFSRRQLSIRHVAIRRATCAFLAVSFIVTAAGIPLPTGRNLSAGEKSNEQFPCATSSCGCRTAAQCWESCCCHTLAERLAWAKQNGVRPPALAIATARAAGHDLSWLDQPLNKTTEHCQIATSSCCSGNKPTKTSCCGTKLSHGEKLSHSDQESLTSAPGRSCCSQPPQNKQTAKSHHSTVIVWQALKCGGKSMTWVAAPPTIASHELREAFIALPTAWIEPSGSPILNSVSDEPVIPPPEQA